MKRLILLALIFTLLFLSANAQNNLPAAYEINNVSNGQVALPDDKWQMLEDHSGKWTFDQVSRSPLKEKFHQNTGFDYSIHTYWIRYRIKNNLNTDAAITIGSNAAYYDIFIVHDSIRWKHFKTGNYIPWSQRDGEKRFVSIPVTIAPGEEILIYKRIEYDYRFFQPITFTTSFRFVDINSDDDFFSTIRITFLFGIFFLTAIIHLIFFGVVRERVYFFYAMAMFFAGLLYFYDPIFHLFFREHPKVHSYSLHFLVTFLLFFLIHTFRYLLRTFEVYPLWDKFLNFFGLLPFLILASVFILGTPAAIWSIVQTILYISLFFTCILYLKIKNKDTQLVITAALPVFVLLGLINIINSFELSMPGLSKIIPGLELIFQVWAISVFSWILLRRYQKLQKQYVQEALDKERLAREKEMEKSQLIAQQKLELEHKVAERTSELTQSLEDLRNMQKQLIHTEKMASLGELTAGIAHEIQNPLNFVNNFSEVSIELLQELKEEKLKGDVDTEIEKEIIADIEQNLQKIVNHGQRADAIVKNMLQHARTSVGEKQLIDINALAEEYLFLSYHGMRAKDKSFNTALETHFDPNVGKVSIIAQDFSRVLLNLFQNAFYSVAEKKRKTTGIGYEPRIFVSTKCINEAVEISVRDNGLGIPKKIIDKMFQPFFTTKPAGEGTGLGLSLSYDIITKGHDGELKVNTVEGEFAEFIIRLPRG